MSKDYLALERHYQIREKRLKDRISQLERDKDDLNVVIKEQQVEIARLRNDLKYKSMLVDRLTKYGNAGDLEKPKKESIFNKLKNIFHR